MVSIRAYAKVNLALAVGPPEPPGSARPGWHPIASWMSCIDLADDLTLARRPEGAASTYAIGWASDAPRPTPIDWPVEKDLAARAHRLLEQHTGRALPVELRLEKRIPVGGGLGGGSSDAAAVLTGLKELFELGISTAELQRLGAALGSDVAFFIDDERPARPAIISGFGEQIERHPRWEADLVILIPPFGCPTAEVYRAYDAAPARPLADRFPGGLLAHLARKIEADRPSFFNDLLAPARAVRPALHDLIERLRLAVGTAPELTGSGSCLFYWVYGPEIPARLKVTAGAAPECVCVRARLV